MKLFLAIDIPEEVTKQVVRDTEGLRRDYPQFNWVPTRNFHITVYYFGDKDEKKLPRVIEQVERAAFDVAPTYMFSLEAAMFVNQTIIPHIAFQRNKDIEKIHERLENVYGEQKTRNKWKYVPHITLARYKLPSKQQYFHLKKKLSKLDTDLEFEVKELHLYQSISKPTNPEYIKMHSFTLRS